MLAHRNNTTLNYYCCPPSCCCTAAMKRRWKCCRSNTFYTTGNYSITIKIVQTSGKRVEEKGKLTRVVCVCVSAEKLLQFPLKYYFMSFGRFQPNTHWHFALLTFCCIRLFHSLSLHSPFGHILNFHSTEIPNIDRKNLYHHVSFHILHIPSVITMRIAIQTMHYSFVECVCNQQLMCYLKKLTCPHKTQQEHWKHQKFSSETKAKVFIEKLAN